jgi:hypothetical protein
MEQIEQRPSSSMMRERSAASHDALKDEESQVQAVRSKVTLVLEHRLASRFSGKGKDQHQILKKLAKFLEQLLFQSSSSFAEYSDLSTLENRMRLELTVKLQRRLTMSTKQNRTRILIRILGKKKFIRVQDLVVKIKLEKNKKVATMKCSGGVCSIPFRGSLPQVVRDLFF